MTTKDFALLKDVFQSAIANPKSAICSTLFLATTTCIFLPQ